MSVLNKPVIIGKGRASGAPEGPQKPFGDRGGYFQASRRPLQFIYSVCWEQPLKCLKRTVSAAPGLFALAFLLTTMTWGLGLEGEALE